MLKKIAPVLLFVISISISACRGECRQEVVISASLCATRSAVDLSALEKDYSIRTLTESALYINNERFVNLIGFDASVEHVAYDAGRDLGILQMNANARAHCRIYVIFEGSERYLLFEVSEIPGAEDRPMTDVELVALLDNNRQRFMSIQNVATIVEPWLADDALRHEIIFPGNYVVTREYRRKP